MSIRILPATEETASFPRFTPKADTAEILGRFAHVTATAFNAAGVAVSNSLRFVLLFLASAAILGAELLVRIDAAIEETLTLKKEAQPKVEFDATKTAAFYRGTAPKVITSRPEVRQ